MASITYSGTFSSYRALLANARVLPRWQGAIERAANACIRNRLKYEMVSARTGVPWEWIAAAHWRESSGDFRGILHNGEKILGTGRKTRLAPYNRGPFTTWEEAAIDALRIKGLERVTDWSDERYCYEFERFNGFGYRRNPGRPYSPYLWSGTTNYTRGKYVRDHVYDPSFVDEQIGAVPLWLRIRELTVRKEVIQNSSKLSTLKKIKTGLQGLVATIAGLFSLDTLGVIREWFTLANFLKPEVQVTIGLTILFVYILINWLTDKTVQDHNEGRYVPSGEVQPDAPSYHPGAGPVDIDYDPDSEGPNR